MAKKTTAATYLKLQTGEAEKNLKNYRKALREARRDLEGATVGTKQYQDAMKRTQQLDRVIKNHNKQLYGMGRAWQQVKNVALGFLGGSIITSGFRMISNAVRKGARTIAEYQTANSNLNAILGVTKEETASLREQQLKLGKSTEYTASQTADAQTELAKLGFTIQEIGRTTPAILAAATVGSTDLANAATIVGSTIRQFGMEASESNRVVDVMAKSFSSTALDVGKFQVAMATAGPVAASANVSFERTTALIGQLVDRGLDASTAGTSLRNIFLDVAKSGMTYEQAMTKINTATDKNVAALDMFGKKGATAAVILSETTVAADDLTRSLENSAGAADEMAKAKLDNIAGDVTKLKSAWEGFILSVENGEGVIAQSSRSLVQWGTRFLRAIDAMSRASEDGDVAWWDLATLHQMTTLTDAIDVWGDSMEDALAKGNFAGAKSDLEYLKDMRKEMEEGSKSAQLLGNRIRALQRKYDEAARARVGGSMMPDKEVSVASDVDSTGLAAAQKKLETALAKLNETIKRERLKQELASLEGQARELAAIDQHYAKLLAEAEGHAEQLAQLEELKESARQAVLEKYAQQEADRKEKEQLDAESKIDDELFKNASEIEQVTMHYDAMLELARASGHRIQEVEDAKTAALKAIRDRDKADAIAAAHQKAQAEIQAAQMAFGSIAGIVSNLAEIQGANAQFQMDMALFQQVINAGLALSNAAASAKGITPVDYLASLGIVIAAITTRIAQARKETEGAGAPPVPGFRKGTISAPGGRATVNEGGEEEIFLPQGSMVMTAGETAGRSGAMFGPGFTGGRYGTTTSGQSGQADTAAIIERIESWQSQFEVIYSDRSHADFKDRQHNNQKYLGYKN